MKAAKRAPSRGEVRNGQVRLEGHPDLEDADEDQKEDWEDEAELDQRGSTLFLTCCTSKRHPHSFLDPPNKEVIGRGAEGSKGPNDLLGRPMARG